MFAIYITKEGTSMRNVTEYFGENVFNESVMKARLPKDTFKQVQAAIYNGKRLDPSAAAVVANAIKDGYILRKDDGSFFVTVPCFTAEQKRTFDAIVEKYFAELMPEYSKIAETFITDYKKLFPKHLNDDVDRMCQNMFSNLYVTIVSYAQKN